jgi:hypothetical protein
MQREVRARVRWASARRARTLLLYFPDPFMCNPTDSTEDCTPKLDIAIYSDGLFVAHTLGAPDQALQAVLHAGTVTALVGLFCVGLVAIRTLFLIASRPLS